ncbi:glycoside hydrolase family protein [Cronobacter dublinensis]|uniref:glycoside hydrolase family protein n=1 Tax=Cronobacter dublinensis TaxID=413497 RepID=UPI000D0071A6|nr:glycoside hydrolase family protein [Cronobacter dublinensis]
MSVLPKISFPVSSNGQGKEFNNQEELLAHLDGENSGPYLVGTQGMWHGGIHITNLTTPWCALSGSNASELQYVAGKPFGGEQPVKCMADGEIVAYRVCEDYESVNWRGNPLFFSDSFVLVKHYVQPGETKASGLTFYTLYMNMAPFSAYRQDNADERETASALSYYASAEDVKSGKKAGSLPAGSRLTLGNGVISAPRDLQNRQYSEVTLVKAAKDTELVTGTTVWVVSDRNNLKLTSGAADLPSWWANCSPAYNPSGTSLARYRTAKNWRYYLSSDDVLANRSAGTLTAGFPVSADLSNNALRVVRSSDSHTFSLVTLGQAVGKEIKGNRVWVVSDADSLIPENDAASGDQPEFGKVVNLSTPVKIQAGDSIGHLGFFELPTDTGRLSRYQVHIECLSMDENLERFLTNPERAGEEDPVCVKYEKDAPLMMPDEKGAMMDVQRKTKAPGLLTLSQVSTVDEDGHSTADKKRAAYYEVEPEGGWLAAEHVQKMSRYALAALGFTTLKSTSENFDLIDGIHHPADVVKGILEQLYAAAKEDPRSSYALNAYNYRQLLEQADSNHDGYYSEEEYVQAIHNASYRDRLFRLIVKHPGEWYYGREDAPWKNYLDSLGKDVQEWRDYTEAFLDKIIWMKQVPCMIAEPWHMHPVMFLGVLKPRTEKQVIFPLKVKPENDPGHVWARFDWRNKHKANMAAFGANRNGARKHAARDLYTKPYEEVVAICDGIVLDKRNFYCETIQVTIKHQSNDGRLFLVRYGELDPKSVQVSINDVVEQGQLIGTTGKLLDDGVPVVVRDGRIIFMLHFEYYSGANGFNLLHPLTDNTRMPYQRRSDLEDPLPILEEGYRNSFYENNELERLDVRILKTSVDGKLFIKAWESLELEPYDDTNGFCTIGYGHLIEREHCNSILIPPQFQNGITQENAELLFDEDLVRYEESVRQAITVKLFQNEFDALVSLLFNCGENFFRLGKAPLLIDCLNSEDYSGAAEQFLDITNGGDSGLIKRRSAEYKLFKDSIYDSQH